MEAIHSKHVDGNLLAEFIPCPVLLLPLWHGHGADLHVMFFEANGLFLFEDAIPANSLDMKGLRQLMILLCWCSFFRICVPVNIAKKMMLLFSLFLVSNEQFQVYAAAVVGIGCFF
jgi:hypothetical protein